MSLFLNGLMKPQRVAIVGASERPDAIGTRVLTNLQKMGFTGTIYLVNPRYRSIHGLSCYASLSDLPETVDVAFLAVPAAAGPDLVEEAGRCGIQALIINANGYADGDATGVALQQRIEAIAKRYNIVLSGPNHLGLINVHDRVALWTPRYMKVVKPGSVAVISQSGSIALILGEDERDLGFAYLMTAGNEAGATVADYLYQMVQDDRVTIILMLLETIRDPATFAQAAQEASRRGKRIVALKLGTSATGRALVQAHTGSLAGEDRLYDAFFKTHGVIRVRDLDEMLETATVLSKNPNVAPPKKTVMLSLSGGEAALLADLCSELGLTLPPLSEETLARLRPAFPSYSTIGNPVDAWGLGFNDKNFRIILNALLADPDIGTIAFLIDAPARGGGDVPYACAMARACAEINTDKCMVFINNTTGTGVNEEVREILDAANIAYLSGTRAGLTAIRNYVNHQPVSPNRSLPMSSAGDIPLSTDEVVCFEQLSIANVPMVRVERVSTVQEAIDTAERLHYPVVMKGIAPHLPHKSDLGLVKVGLANVQEITHAFNLLSTTLAEHAIPGSSGGIVIQEMARGGIELIVGIRNEKDFGSFVVVGLGGIFVEINNQVSIRMGPVDIDQARAMLNETAAGKMLKGVRGQGPWDIEAAAAAIAAFSQVGAAQIENFAALEINPLIVDTIGAKGVDVLIEPYETNPLETQ